MNKNFTILAAAIFLFFSSCQKSTTNPTASTRKIQFILYTNKDFSGNTDIIDFSLHITNNGNKLILDSALAPMQIKDIPGPSKKLVFTKTVPDDGTIITAGFNYTIRNVGMSWYLDTLGANTKSKVIEYSFQ